MRPRDTHGEAGEATAPSARAGRPRDVAERPQFILHEVFCYLRGGEVSMWR
jgi:hypothetical protein